MQIIKAKNLNGKILNTGPMQFGNDWPGVFLSLDFIQKNLKPFFDIPDPVERIEQGMDDLVTAVVVYAFKHIGESLGEQMNNQAVVSVVDLKPLQVIEVEGPDEDDDAYQRVETDPVSIDGQIGYFFRGDNAMYYSMILEQKRESINNPMMETMAKVFGACNAGNFS